MVLVFLQPHHRVNISCLSKTLCVYQANIPFKGGKEEKLIRKNLVTLNLMIRRMKSDNKSQNWARMMIVEAAVLELIIVVRMNERLYIRTRLVKKYAKEISIYIPSLYPS